MSAGIIPLRTACSCVSEKSSSFEPYLETCFAEKGNAPRGAVIVCPGGGYGMRADHEGMPIAEKFRDAGMHAFVLQYRVAPERHPAPIQDASRAIRIVRSRAAEWGIDPNKIAILGFSAGGHLTASTGILAGQPCTMEGDSLDSVSSRPDAMIPCYPVITPDPACGHVGSFYNLFGDNPDAEKLRLMSLDKHVTAQTPPTFLWHTAADKGVPVQNSLVLATALAAHGVPFALHVFPDGPHGIGLAEAFPQAAAWMPLCITWLRDMGWSSF